MKKYCLFFSLILTAVLYQNCCKVYCPRQSMNLTFIGFEAAELDSFIISRFEPGGFITPTHTRTVTLVTSTRDTIQYSLFNNPDELDLSKNYEVAFPKAGRTYHISDIKTRRFKCKCGQRDGKAVAGYVLDGQRYAAETVYLKK